MNLRCAHPPSPARCTRFHHSLNLSARLITRIGYGVSIVHLCSTISKNITVKSNPETDKVDVSHIKVDIDAGRTWGKFVRDAIMHLHVTDEILSNNPPSTCKPKVHAEVPPHCHPTCTASRYAPKDRGRLLRRGPGLARTGTSYDVPNANARSSFVRCYC